MADIPHRKSRPADAIADIEGEMRIAAGEEVVSVATKQDRQDTRLADVTGRFADMGDFTWQELFRDALKEGKGRMMAEALRRADTLDRATLDVLASLFEDDPSLHNIYRFRLKLVRRKRGTPKKRKLDVWGRDEEIAQYVAEGRMKEGAVPKAVIQDAMKKFGLGRTSIQDAISRVAKKKPGS